MIRLTQIMVVASIGVISLLIACTEEVERPGTGTPTPTIAPTMFLPSPTSTVPIGPSPTPRPTPIPVPAIFLDVHGPADRSILQSDAVVVYGATTREATVMVGQEIAFVDQDGSFQAEVTFLPGDNSIEVTATDATGTRLSTVVTVTFQPRQPILLVITEPEHQSVVVDGVIPVIGRTAPGVKLTVNRVEVEVDWLGSFSTRVALREGPNAIEIAATNPDGRVRSATIAVIYRLPEPTAEFFLDIEEPVSVESVVAESAITVVGRTRIDAVVSVGAIFADIDDDGRFRVPVELEEGPNIIEVVASAGSGEELVEILVVIYSP